MSILKYFNSVMDNDVIQTLMFTLQKKM